MDKRGGFEEIRWGKWGSRVGIGSQAIAEESADDREVILRLRDNRL